MTVKLEVNLLASEDTRRDILQLIRENIANALSSEGSMPVRDLIGEKLAEYIGSHDLSSLVPGLLSKAMPDIIKMMHRDGIGLYMVELLTGPNTGSGNPVADAPQRFRNIIESIATNAVRQMSREMVQQLVADAVRNELLRSLPTLVKPVGK